VTPGVTPAWTYEYTPTQLQSAYALPTGTQGTGLTVAIVDAYDLPTAESDLASYRSTYGLPACTTGNGCFRKVNQNGVQGSYPAANSGWGGEIALDIEMVSAICPHCNILLVEANDSGYVNLAAAEDMAVSMGAVAVSNSYGGPEWSGETSFDSHFNHPGVAITVATGDCGYNCTGQPPNTAQNVEYPAASPYVIAVGGTSLVPNGSARGWGESAWGNANGGAGSGCSLYEPKPSWQHDPSCSNRTQADVSAVADPQTGVLVYEAGSWYVFGGTSVASPIVAATYALAGGPAAGSYPARYLYADAADLNDAVGGNSDVTYHSCTVAYLCQGVAGYDGPTGLGTPHGIAAFTSPSLPGAPTGVTSTPGNGSALVSWTAPASPGSSPIGGYAVTSSPDGRTCTTTVALFCTVSGLTNGTPYTFTVTATNGVGPGPASVASSPVTPATLPGAPTGVAAIPGVAATPGNASALVSWAAPASNGSPISSYTVTSSPDAHTCGWTSGPLQCTVSALVTSTPYTFTVTATNGVGTGPSSDPSSAVTLSAPFTGATFHPLSPSRLVDTRIGNGLPGKLVAGVPGTFQVTGRFGISAGAVAITANVAAVNEGAVASLYLGPGPLASPPTATMNFNHNDTRASGSTIALSPAGTISATYMAASGTTDLVLDVTGFFTPDSSGDTYHPLTPVRLLDSRHANGLSGKFKPSAPRQFQVTGRGGVPASARAVTGNLTVTDATGSWAAYIGPAPIARPGSSTINFVKGQTRANSLTVQLSPTGTLWATFMGSGKSTVDLVFDVTGYYTADLTGSEYVPLTPVRLLDTRSGIGLAGKFVARAPRTFGVWNLGNVPGTATGVTGIVSVYNQTSTWAVFVGPDPIANPTTSSLNFVVGDNCSNGFTVPLSPTGTLSATYLSGAGKTTNVLVVITGYFVGP
jgi:hypothetical protein